MTRSTIELFWTAKKYLLADLIVVLASLLVLLSDGQVNIKADEVK